MIAFITIAPNGSVTCNVLSNDQYRGACGSTGLVPATVGSGGNVTITNVTNALPAYSISPSTGQIIPGTPINSGSYILNYTLCDNLFPSLCITLSVSITVPANRIGLFSENQFELSKTKISPNPTKNIASIQFNDLLHNKVKLYLFDMLGRTLLVKQIETSTSIYELELSNYTNAHYLLLLENSETSETFKKIIIKN